MSAGSTIYSFCVIAGLVLAERGCVDQEGAVKVLKVEGYSSIQTSPEHRWFGCGYGDFWHTEFSAKGPTQEPARGVICHGLSKASTLRIDQ